MIAEVISDREQTRDAAVGEVTSKWGGKQVLIGPWIVVPYDVVSVEEVGDGGPVERRVTRYASFLPDQLDVSGSLIGEERYRGIYEVPVFRTELEFSGRFARPTFTGWSVAEGAQRWDRAFLAFRVSDAGAILNKASISWNDREIDFHPGVGEGYSHQAGIHVPLTGALKGDDFAFSFDLQLNGSEGLFFAPYGKQTSVNITSNWPDPGFDGQWLPDAREIRGDGFTARWHVPFLGRNYPQRWRSDESVDQVVGDSLFGVRLVTMVDNYRMAHRSVKYEFLFLVLTFATLWLFEVLSCVRIHPLQYLLLGAAMCLFYLLELSLAEHIGFLGAYVVASSMVVSLMASYSRFVLGTTARAGIAGLVVGLLYSFLYILLSSQDYALLAGALGLFVALALVMFLTRNVDWYGDQAPGDGPTQDADSR
jgi:inner membrane protein